MTQDELNKLRSLPIEGVAERLGLVVERHKCLCPFHDDHHASLTFDVRKNRARCFVCMNESISVIDLAMKLLPLRGLGGSFLDACQWLADDSNIILQEYKPSSPSEDKKRVFDASRYERFFLNPRLTEKAREFLYGERMIDPRVVRYCRLHSWQDKRGVNWLEIPYYNIEGRLIGIQNRNLDRQKDSPDDASPEPRFRFPSGASCSIYNLQVINRLSVGEPLYICEGASDCWSMLSSGHKAISIPSATLLKPSDVGLLQALASPADGSRLHLSTEFHMYPDNDQPGRELFNQLKEVLPGLIRHDLPEDCRDYSEYYKTKTPQPPLGGEKVMGDG